MISPASALLCLIVLWLCPLALSQGGVNSGAIQGVVRDAAGAVVADATVTATNIGTNVRVSTKSSAVGDYSIPNLVPGRYTVVVDQPGFKKFVE